MNRARIVCGICDADKRPHRGQEKNSRSWCTRCARDTDDRVVGADNQYIAPESVLTFKRQRELFEQERKRA